MSPAAVLAKSGEAVKAGPIGLAVILLLCIACYFLFKSMSKHLREVRENFPAEPSTPGPLRRPAGDTPSAAAPGALPRVQVIPPAGQQEPPAVDAGPGAGPSV